MQEFHDLNGAQGLIRPTRQIGAGLAAAIWSCHILCHRTLYWHGALSRLIGCQRFKTDDSLFIGAQYRRLQPYTRPLVPSPPNRLAYMPSALIGKMNL